MRIGQLSGVVAIAVVAISLLWGANTPARATPLAVGGSVPGPGDAFGDLSGDTVVASDLGQTMLSSTGDYTAIANVEVVRDPNNTACGVANACLDFLYQVTNSSTSSNPIITLSMSNFTGFSTDVGFATAAPNGLTSTGDIAPDTIERPFDDVINFNYTSGSLSPGNTTDILVIATNATVVTPGTLATINSGTANFGGFSPGPAPAIGQGLPVALAIGGVLFGVWGWGRGNKHHSAGTAIPHTA